MRSKRRKNHLTLCLIKDGIEWDRIIKEREGLVEIKIDERTTLYVRPSRSNPPSWLRFFEGRVNTDTIGVFNASSAAALLVKHDSRVFGLTFGHGRHLFDDGVVEPTFGLRVVLNAIDPERIRTIDKDSLDVIGRRTREQVSKEDSIASFGLNIDQDLIRAVTGGTNDEELGSRLTGADSLALCVPIALTNLPPLLAKCLKLYQSKDYRKAFSWVDHIGEVRDSAAYSKLDDRLVTCLRKSEVEKIWLAVPEVLDWSKVRGFRYGGWHHREIVDDIYMPDFLECCGKLSEVTIELLKRWKVECIDAETDRVSHTWSLYNCIYAELNHDSGLYILNGGKWYRVDRDFVTEVDESVRTILRSPSSLKEIIPYSDVSEEEYNNRVCNSDSESFALMDRKIISYSGRHSKIEFCDIYTNKQAMIHIKRYSGSSVLSHLFAQGVVSAEAFAQDANFREKVNAELPTGFALSNPRGQVDPSNFEVIYGIISKSKDELVLPFFSRVTLRNAHRRLSAMRYKVSVVKIPIE